MAKGQYKFKYIGDFKPSPNTMAIVENISWFSYSLTRMSK